MRMLVGVGVCDAHKVDAAEVYVTDQMWKGLLGVLDRAGKARPHRSFTRVEYLDLDDPEAQAFEADFG